MAASADRELMDLGKPQKDGTRFSARKTLCSSERYEVDPSVTDEERDAWGRTHPR